MLTMDPPRDEKHLRKTPILDVGNPLLRSLPGWSVRLAHHYILMLLPVVALHPGMTSLLLKTLCTSDKRTRGPGSGSDLKISLLRTLFYVT